MFSNGSLFHYPFQSFTLHLKISATERASRAIAYPFQHAVLMQQLVAALHLHELRLGCLCVLFETHAAFALLVPRHCVKRLQLCIARVLLLRDMATLIDSNAARKSRMLPILRFSEVQ